MNRQEANKQILDMYNDSTYQELKAYYEKTTIFNVLGVERSETRHSAFLCWLLNANASHGLGEEPMKKLLRLYATKMDDDSSFRIMLMTGDYELEMNDIVTEKKHQTNREAKEVRDSVLISKFHIGKIGHFNKRDKEKSSAHDN